MQGMPLFLSVTAGGWTVASENGRPKGPFASAGLAMSFAVRAIDRLNARGRAAWIVMDQPDLSFVDHEPAIAARPLAAMPSEGLCGCSGW